MSDFTDSDGKASIGGLVASLVLTFFLDFIPVNALAMHEQENGNESSHNSSTNETSSVLLKSRYIPEFAELSASTYNLPFCSVCV